MKIQGFKRINKVKMMGKYCLCIPLLIFAVVSIFTSCINERDTLTGDNQKENPEYILRLNIVAGINDTRSSGHGDIQGLPAENYINPDDLSVVIYNQDGGKIEDLAKPTVYFSEGVNYIESYLDKEIFDGISSFQVMVVANWKSYDRNSSYPVSDSFSSLIDGSDGSIGLWKNNTDYNFTYQKSTGNEAWYPSIEDKRLIPMFGIKTINIDEFRYDVSGSKRATTTIPMLRSLAKIDVVDNTPEGYEISNVKLSKYNNQGRFIPNISKGSGNENWSERSIQITKPSLPSDLTQGNALTLYKYTDSGEIHWIAYIPEFDMTGLNLTDDRPHLEIEVKTGSNNEYKNYQLQLAEYDYNTGLFKQPGEEDSWNYTLRNHIYQFQVNSSNVYTDLTLTATEWDLADEEIWYYEDIPGSVESIKWSQYLSIDESVPSVTLNMSQEETQILKGTFSIPQPRSGTWHAYLMTIGIAIPTAIEFCNADGTGFEDDNLKKHVSGQITYNSDGELVPNEIYIRVAEPGKAQQASSFKLVVMVENLGNWMEVKLVPTNPDGSSAGRDNWEIIRPLNDFQD